MAHRSDDQNQGQSPLAMYVPVLNATGVLILCLGMIASLMISCSKVPEQISPPLLIPDQFSNSGEMPITQRWWEDLNDSQLNQNMELALENNLSLRASWDRLSSAQAIAQREGAGLWPTVNGSLGGDMEHQKRNELTANTTSLIMGLAVSYEVDLWGRIRNAHRASEFDIQVTEQDIHTTAISLTASLAETWYNLAGSRATLKILEEQVKNNKKQLDLLTKRFNQGQSQAVDLLRQQQLLESTEGLKRNTERQVALFEHQILVLMGRAPQEQFPTEMPAMIALPPLPETGLPSALIRRRPDLRSAELEIMAEDRRLASAIGSQFPRLSLTADLSKSGKNISDLLDNWMASIAASLAQPLFDAGRLASEVDRQKAIRSEAINNYGQLVLEAFQEVEDALISEQKQRQFLASLKRQLDLSQKVIQRSETGYLNGQLDYLNVLTAITSRQSLERQYVSAQTELMIYRIQLYRALAGGFDLQRPELRELTEQGETLSGDNKND